MSNFTEHNSELASPKVNFFSNRLQRELTAKQDFWTSYGNT